MGRRRRKINEDNEEKKESRNRYIKGNDEIKEKEKKQEEVEGEECYTGKGDEREVEEDKKQ